MDWLSPEQVLASLAKLCPEAITRATNVTRRLLACSIFEYLIYSFPCTASFLFCVASLKHQIRKFRALDFLGVLKLFIWYTCQVEVF